MPHEHYTDLMAELQASAAVANATPEQQAEYFALLQLAQRVSAIAGEIMDVAFKLPVPPLSTVKDALAKAIANDSTIAATLPPHRTLTVHHNVKPSPKSPRHRKPPLRLVPPAAVPSRKPTRKTPTPQPKAPRRTMVRGAE